MSLKKVNPLYNHNKFKCCKKEFSEVSKKKGQIRKKSDNNITIRAHQFPVRECQLKSSWYDMKIANRINLIM